MERTTRKIAISFLLSLLAVGLLSGCSLFKSNEIVPPASDEAVLEKRTGLVSTPQEQNIANPVAPYLLLADSGEVIFLDSIGINLKRYVGRRVEVEGVNDPAQKLMQVDSLTSVGQETRVKTTITNGELGVKLSVPSVWHTEVKENTLGDRRMVITPYEVSESELSSVDRITIFRSENNKRLAPREWLDLDEFFRPVLATEADKGVVYQESIIGLSQLPSVKKTDSKTDTVTFYVQRDTFTYLLQHETVGDADADLYRNAFFEIVGTFDFVPFSDQSTVTPSTSESTTPSATESTTDTPQQSETPTAPQSTPTAPSTSPASQTPAQSSTSTDSSVRASYVTFLKGAGRTLLGTAPEGEWELLRVEFAYPDETKPFAYVYATYGADNENRRILLSVVDYPKPSTMTKAAVFTSGAVTDWELSGGEDKARGLQKVTQLVSNGNAEVAVKPGMQLINARSFKVTFQIPSSWYWSAAASGYLLGDKPVTTSTYLVRLEKNPTVPAGLRAAETTESGRQLKEAPGEGDQGLTLCATVGSDTYCAYSTGTKRETLVAILDSIQE
ncbi:hypothetical protein CO046_00600 [Candidatus Peregrinibacteria bacterium CG_4_9_14_0_2_um_filter_53_11]|nr:MAG: hypothetical protein CO046_00600 [Candidatus Peregrinibacteria bacterium CG_4_9_14_0_2_um_filter_53_11]